MKVENEGDEDRRLPTALEMRVEDTTGDEYKPIELDPVFGLELGGIIEAGGEAPDANTAAASGPVQGAIVLFLVEPGRLEQPAARPDHPRRGRGRPRHPRHLAR